MRLWHETTQQYARRRPKTFELREKKILTIEFEFE